MPPLHYCDLSDVNDLVPQAPFTASSRPSDGKVADLIESVALEIDATIGNVGYVVPVVEGARALALLKETCAWGVLGIAQTIRETGVKVAVSDRGQPIENIWTLKYRRRLEALTDPRDSFELPDAPRTSEQLLKQGEDVLRSHVQADTDRFADRPTITRDQVL